MDAAALAALLRVYARRQAIWQGRERASSPRDGYLPNGDFYSTPFTPVPSALDGLGVVPRGFGAVDAGRIRRAIAPGTADRNAVALDPAQMFELHTSPPNRWGAPLGDEL